MNNNRIKNIQSSLSGNEGIIITSEPNRFYVTGFNSSDGWVALTKTDCVFFVDFRYYEKAKSVVKSCDVVLADNLVNQIKKFFSNLKIKTVYPENRTMSVTRHSNLQTAFDNIILSTDDKADKLLCDARAVKSETELENIRLAQEMTDRTFEYTLQRIDENRTELEIMLDMEFYMRRLGSEGVSFDFIVVSGENSSLPHGVPTSRKLKKGDFVTMDFGAVVNGYRSDMTRTVAIGSVTDEQRQVYDTVLKAQNSALGSIRSGQKCADIDKIARDIIYNSGYKGCFGHALGHSVGIEIHEQPTLSPNSKDTLQSGVVMTVEPGIYLENKFGVRIEDMVFVENDGCENITKSEKKLIII